MRGILIVALLSVGVVGCYPSDPDLENAMVVLKYLQQDSPHGESVTFQARPYFGGTAVLSEGDAAYWVKDGQGYTVNDHAVSLAPDLPKAPAPIKFNEVFQDQFGLDENGMGSFYSVEP